MKSLRKSDNFIHRTCTNYFQKGIHAFTMKTHKTMLKNQSVFSYPWVARMFWIRPCRFSISKLFECGHKQFLKIVYPEGSTDSGHTEMKIFKNNCCITIKISLKWFVLFLHKMFMEKFQINTQGDKDV